MQAQYKKTGKSCVKVVYKTFQMPLNPSEIKGLRHIYAKTLDFTGFSLLFLDYFSPRIMRRSSLVFGTETASSLA